MNIFVEISWKFYNNYSYSKRDPIAGEARPNFKLNLKNQRILHKSTYNMKYYYRAFVGVVPDNIKSKYVNYNRLTGRETFNISNNCKKKIFFLGGSSTFGWLSTDQKTIPSQFSKNLKEEFIDHCVFNFGSPGFYSKQENNFLINLMEKKEIKPDFVIFIDGVNERCHGFRYEKNIKDQFDELMVEHRTDIIKKKFLPFVKSLPIHQLLTEYFIKPFPIKDLDENHSCDNTELKNLFQSRLEMRLKICNNYGIKCLSFLQPIGGILDGKTYTVKQHKKRYKAFKEIPDYLIIDLTGVLDDELNKYSYIDSIHYSHYANNLIAKEILVNFKTLNKIK